MRWRPPGQPRIPGLAALALASALTLSAPVPAADPENQITLNLQNTDISALINTVSEITGRNFVVDPRVKANNITVVSSRPMAADELYNVFLSILQVHGISAIDAGNVTKIVPDVSAKQTGLPAATRDMDTDEMVTRVIQLDNVSANQVVPILRPLVPQYGHLAAYAPTNVLIISDRATNIARLAEVIARIDREATSDVEFIQLQYASAAEVARILTALQARTRAKTEPGEASTVVADERTNSVIVSGEASDRVAMRGLIAKLDMPVVGGAANVVYLRYAKAPDLAAILEAMFKTEQGKQQGAGGVAVPVIQADEATNALIIDADSEQLNRMRAIIRQLDIRRRQVLVEAVLAEVSFDVQRELGIEWAAGDDGTAVIGSIFPPSVGGGLQDLLINQTVGPGLTAGAGDDSGSTQWAAVLRALQGDANTNVLSTPTLVTLDNEEASIVVGQNVPFITGQFVGGSAGTTDPQQPFQTIERQDVGLTLRVTPQINEGDAVQLEITTEVSSVTDSTVASDIITQKREIKTNVLVSDGQVVVLGGLISDEVRDSVRKVPGLGDIPGIGELFKSRRSQKIKQNLMVFIHPVILKDDLADAYTERKYGYLKARQIEARARAAFKRSKEFVPDSMPDLRDMGTPRSVDPLLEGPGQSGQAGRAAAEAREEPAPAEAAEPTESTRTAGPTREWWEAVD